VSDNADFLDHPVNRQLDGYRNEHSGGAATEVLALREARQVRLIFCLLAAAIVAITFVARASSVLQDPDNFWQVKVGLDILSSHTLPTVDTYSYTFAGHPWIAKEWLGQVLLGLAYEAAGWNGVALVTIAAVSLTAFVFAWALSAELRPTVPLGLAVVMALFVSPVFNARPFIFTFPIVVVWTAQLFQAARDERAPPLWLLPLMCLWANLHAAFTFGFVIAAFAGLDVLERTRLSKPRLLAKWIGFGLLCPLVSLLNPYGAKAILATFTVAYGNEAVPYIAEWFPFNATERFMHEWVLLLVFFGLLTSRLRIGWAKAAFIVFALHLFLIHIRFVYLLFLLGPVVIAAEVADQYPMLAMRNWAAAGRDGLERFLAKQFRAICLGIAATFALSAVILTAVIHVAPDEGTTAEGAIAYAEGHKLTGNVFNNYHFGGVLIFHGIKTFIDGRTDQLFLGGFAKQYFDTELSSGKPILAKKLDEYRVSWALLRAKDERIPHFEDMPDWKRVYADKDAVIFVRDK